MKSKSFRCLLLLVVTVLFAGRTALAQAPAAAPAPAKIIIHAGHMLDVKTGKMLGESAIVIVGDKIDGHGPWLPETVDGQHANWAAMGKAAFETFIKKYPQPYEKKIADVLNRFMA